MHIVGVCLQSLHPSSFLNKPVLSFHLLLLGEYIKRLWTWVIHHGLNTLLLPVNLLFLSSLSFLFGSSPHLISSLLSTVFMFSLLHLMFPLLLFYPLVFSFLISLFSPILSFPSLSSYVVFSSFHSSPFHYPSLFFLLYFPSPPAYFLSFPLLLSSCLLFFPFLRYLIVSSPLVSFSPSLFQILSLLLVLLPPLSFPPSSFMHLSFPSFFLLPSFLSYT